MRARRVGPACVTISRKVCAVGSLRNPVGPLPSTIYWRRRAVLLSVVALLALLITWIVSFGGGGGKKGADGADGKNPQHTITPGPTPSGSAISQHPGGRDESGGGDSDGSGSGTGGDGGGTDAGSSGSAGSAGSGGSGDGSGSGSGSGSGNVGTGDAIPASSSLRNCSAGSLVLSLRSLHNSYSPDQTPTFELTAKNSASEDCKVDLGPKNAVLTITPADGDDAYWSSDDCPKGAGSLLFRVTAGKSITYTVTWDRKPSAAHCATPPAGSAKAGTYLLEAKAPGLTKTQASFVLSAD
ncbi:hypothetical protein SAMN05428944_4394 [Streptomyces sp. 1222.5]|nr:hypothetical protein BX260_3702 [Streptomyces sp. 5112.2]SEC61531.1 hypothetical protein SAMN05428944_4394 [Streptomyces sp. 1222.5]SED23448.1 hypothetical protein SAMN05216532_3890 [Streptomyces sp. 2231.1]